MRMGAAATKKKKKGGSPINLDFLCAFLHSSPEPKGDVCFVSSSTPAARKGKARGKALARSSPDSPDCYSVSPPSAPAKGKRRREEEGSDGEFFGMSNGELRRDIAEMSDGELRREIEGLSALGQEKRERRQRLLQLLEKESRDRLIRMEAAKDGGDRDRGARSRHVEKVFTFNIEDEKTEGDAYKYCQKSSPIRSTRKNYGSLGVQTRRSSSQTGLRKPIGVDKMYSSKTSPSALRGNKQRVHAVDPKEHDNGRSRQNENNSSRNYAKKRKAHHEDSSLLRQKVNDVVLLDDEDVQPDEPPDEPVDCAVLDKWKELKINYPLSDDPEAVELSSSDIRCLNPGVYLSSPVINYYIQYIKRAEMHIEYGTDKFYIFNTYFYSKLQEALLDKGKFLKLRRWWKGVNIFQRGYIMLPIHGTSHWSLIIVCIPAKESNSGPIILHLDSLGMHPSAEIFDTVGRYLEEEWRHLRKNPPSDIPISDKIWQDLPRNIQKEKVEVPGQNNAYDCGIFMLYYIQHFIRKAPERFTRDSLDMFSRNWFRSEVASALRKKIRELLLKLFGNARVGDVMSEAAASDGLDEECIIKEGASEAVNCRSGDTSTRHEEDVMEVNRKSDGRFGNCALSEANVLFGSLKDDEEGIIKEEPEALTPCDSSDMVAGGGDTSTRNEQDVMEVKSLEGTPSTTRRSDGWIGDCALSEAAVLSDSGKDDDEEEECIMKEGEPEAVTPCDSSELAVGGGDTSTRDEEDFIEVSSWGGTRSTTRGSNGRIRHCGLSKAATLSHGIEDAGTMKPYSDSSKT